MPVITVDKSLGPGGESSGFGNTPTGGEATELSCADEAAVGWGDGRATGEAGPCGRGTDEDCPEN